MLYTVRVSAQRVDQLVHEYRLDTTHWRPNSLSDEDLFAIIHHLRFQSNAITYNEGIRTVRGYLLGLGLSVPRERVANALRTVDPEGVAHRTFGFQQRQRRVYNVRAPMEMWHLDANCKLNRVCYFMFNNCCL